MFGKVDYVISIIPFVNCFEKVVIFLISKLFKLLYESYGGMYNMLKCLFHKSRCLNSQGEHLV
jgi:hypothetical protein